MTIPLPHPLTLAEMAARESAMHWYTLAIDPQCWRKIGERAADLGYETYCPMGRYHGGVERPLLGGYMFVDMPTDRRQFSLFVPSDGFGERPASLLSAVEGCIADPAKPSLEPIRCCRGWICGPDGRATPMHEAVIDRLRRREAAGEFDMTTTMISDGFVVPKWYRRNLTVEFCSEDAPLRGRMGKISAMSKNGILDIWVPFFKGMTLVHAPIDWIRPVVE